MSPTSTSSPSAQKIRGGTTSTAQCGHGAGLPSYFPGSAIVSTTPHDAQLNPIGLTTATPPPAATGPPGATEVGGIDDMTEGNHEEVGNINENLGNRRRRRYCRAAGPVATRSCGAGRQEAWCLVPRPICRLLLCAATVIFAVGMVGCASDSSPEPQEDTRPRIDQILSPQGAKPNEAFTKRSQYDGEKFKSKSLEKKAYAGSSGTAREADKAFSGAGKQARWSGQESRFGNETAREGSQTARTFASRFDGKEARTQSFQGGDQQYRTGEAREADDAFHTGQPRGYSARTLSATQLSPTARETARLYPADATEPLNVEDVRRVLNKGPRD